MSRIAVSRLGATGLELLAALHQQCFEEAWSRDFLARILASPGAFAFLASTTDAGEPQPAGFVLCRAGGGECEVLSIAVLPAWRGRGVGRVLLRAVMAAARDGAAGALFLEVAADNPAARKLYEGLGFRQVGVRPGYYVRPGGARADALVLRYDLKGDAGK